MITFIIGFLLGLIVYFVRFAIILKNNPDHILETVNRAKKNTQQKDSHIVYFEKDGETYFAYSLPKNTYEGMASSEDDLIELLCEKYPTHDIEILHFEQ